MGVDVEYAVPDHSKGTGFNSWDGGSIGWSTFNSTTAAVGRRLSATLGGYDVYSAVGDDKTALLAQPSTSMQALPTSDAPLANFGPGQFIRVRLQL